MAVFTEAHLRVHSVESTNNKIEKVNFVNNSMSFLETRSLAEQTSSDSTVR